MDFYPANTDVVVRLDLVDDGGNTYDPDRLRYRVVDEYEDEIIPWTNVPASAIDDGVVNLTIEADYNKLVDGFLKGLRIVTFEITASETFFNVQYVEKQYGLREESAPLEVMFNSFQTYAEAILNSTDMAGLEGWDKASRDNRIKALINAYNNLCKLRYRITTLDDWQSTLNYERRVNDLSLLTAEEFESLEEGFQVALKYAQIAEADALLLGNTIDYKRQSGLLSESVGEVSHFFRSAKPLELPVSRRALKYLTGYVTHSPTITRA